ncbi:DUF2231 domain-containing protein [Seleniivibrio woodruffii]|uniref:Putative heme/steroid binding protein n=1 Tax=Seleniivibrio woodruffii TaxID=1078050 RepID=A0A4R1K9A3_9BACT|nr:DUF2231 domain-containing protein [Seleniivibrio woodruffii]TCK60925.1 putative heme/steroid binding protein [Seleniivibrio woodruffii]TVZ36555.1 putative heme/steroid binding protein [Seleniivibrio woodruffii]
MKKEELQNFDGKDGRKSFVSNEGRVYDVTESRLWKNGKHAGKHFAGMDLTEALKSAPHGVEVLERFSHVGDVESMKEAKEKTEQESGLKETIRSLYRIFHPHPMLIHFPMGLINFTVIMQLMYYITGYPSFSTAGFYSLVTATVFMVPTIGAGFVSWWVNYGMTKNKLFMTKIIFSFILLAMCLLEIVLYFSAGDDGALYNVLLFANVPVLGIIGFNGGKLSWG